MITARLDCIMDDITPLCSLCVFVCAVFMYCGWHACGMWVVHGHSHHAVSIHRAAVVQSTTLCRGMLPRSADLSLCTCVGSVCGGGMEEGGGVLLSTCWHAVRAGYLGVVGEIRPAVITMQAF